MLRRSFTSNLVTCALLREHLLQSFMIHPNFFSVFHVIALLVYEYFITFGAEVNLFWRQKLTAAAAFFFLNRYIVLANAAYSNWLDFTPPQTVQVRRLHTSDGVPSTDYKFRGMADVCRPDPDAYRYVVQLSLLYSSRLGSRHNARLHIRMYV